jgi:hypothetical protein
VTVSRRDAERRQHGEHLLEPLALPGEGRVLGFVRGREVGVDGIDRQELTSGDFGKGAFEIVVAESKTVHPRVDLEVAVKRPGSDPTGSDPGLTRV